MVNIQWIAGDFKAIRTQCSPCHTISDTINKQAVKKQNAQVCICNENLAPLFTSRVFRFIAVVWVRDRKS